MQWLSKAHALNAAGIPFALVTVIETKGSTPQETGAKMIVLEDGQIFGTIGGGHLEKLAIEEAAKHFAQVRLSTEKYPLCFRTGQCCGGSVELLTEIIGFRPRLYIFGAGHVGQAICKSLADTRFALHLIDERPEWLHHASVPESVERHGTGWQNFLRSAFWSDAYTYAIITTHDHSTDLEILTAILEGRPTKYVGLIGSSTKRHRFEQRLSQHGITRESIARLHCPIGSEKMGKLPQEIAISVAFELLSVAHGG